MGKELLMGATGCLVAAPLSDVCPPEMPSDKALTTLHLFLPRIKALPTRQAI